MAYFIFWLVKSLVFQQIKITSKISDFFYFICLYNVKQIIANQLFK